MENHTPGPRLAVNRDNQPMNLVPVFLSTVPGRALVDSGAVRSTISGDMYSREICTVECNVKVSGLRK